MDKYKKKSLKFMGLGREVRAVECNTNRAVSRHTRFSLLRCIDNEVDDFEEQPEVKDVSKRDGMSRIPTFGKPNSKAQVTRIEMLQKWKNEKLIKRQQELKSKKPSFKVGFIAPKPAPVLPSFNKTGYTKMQDSKNQTTYNLKTQASIVTNSRLIKDSRIQPSFNSKPQPTSSSNKKLLKGKESQIQPSIHKPTTGISNTKVKKEPQMQLANKFKPALQKPSFSATKEVKSKQEFCIQVPTKSQTNLQKPASSATKEVKSKESYKPKTALQKPSFSAPKEIKNKQNSGKNEITQPHGKPAQIKQTGIPNKNGIKTKLAKVPSKATIPTKKDKSSSEQDSLNITFRCELSHIEPVSADELSFAPKGFLFQPPKELCSFWEEGPTAIFARLKAGTERTSTPKRSEFDKFQEEPGEKSSNETEDGPEVVFESENPNSQDSCTPATTDLKDSKGALKFECPGDCSAENKQPITLLPEAGIPKTENQTTSLLESIFAEIEISSIPDVENPNKQDSITTMSTNVGDCKTSLRFDCLEISTQNKQPVAMIHETGMPKYEKKTKGACETTSSDVGQPCVAASETTSSDVGQPCVSASETTSSDVGQPYMAASETASLNVAQPCMILPRTISSKSSQFYTNSSKTKKLDVGQSSTALSMTCSSDVVQSNIKVTKNSSVDLKETAVSLSDFEEKDSLPITATSSDQQNSLLRDAPITSRYKPATRSSEIKTRGFRRSERPPLEIINESLENSSNQDSTPKSRRTKKTVLFNEVTPRRSLRLAKLSEIDLEENIFDERPSLYGTPELEESVPVACSSKNLAYDFDKLHLESTNGETPVAQRRASTRKGKVSLLYTPPQRSRFSIRKSIKGDLMSFSPDV